MKVSKELFAIMRAGKGHSIREQNEAGQAVVFCMISALIVLLLAVMCASIINK